jgi:hypothetical protein
MRVFLMAQGDYGTLLVLIRTLDIRTDCSSPVHCVRDHRHAVAPVDEVAKVGDYACQIHHSYGGVWG